MRGQSIHGGGLGAQGGDSRDEGVCNPGLLQLKLFMTRITSLHKPVCPSPSLEQSPHPSLKRVYWHPTVVPEWWGPSPPPQC